MLTTRPPTEISYRPLPGATRMEMRRLARDAAMRAARNMREFPAVARAHIAEARYLNRLIVKGV